MRAKLASECELVAAAARQLAAEGLVIGTGGNVSARAGELVAITPTGAKLAELRPQDVTVIDLDGALVDGQLEPTSELELHLGVYRRFDAGAIVHTHAQMSTALSCVVDELPCVHYQLLLLGGTIPVAKYETFGTFAPNAKRAGNPIEPFLTPALPINVVAGLTYRF